MMSEELRLLYVAMTRAKEKLILTLALTEGARALERLGEDLSVPISPLALERQQNVGQWVLLHALTRPEAGGVRELAGLPDIRAEGLGPAWNIRWIDGAPLAEDRKTEGRYTDLPELVQKDISELAAQLRWTYPQMVCANVPSKLTATQIKGRPQDQEAAEEAGELVETVGRERGVIYRPRFMTEEKGLTPAQRGTAIHQAVQYIPLEGDHSQERIGQLLDQLEDRGFLTALQREAVSAQRLRLFSKAHWERPWPRQESAVENSNFPSWCRRRSIIPGRRESISCSRASLMPGLRTAGITVLDFKSDR